MLLPTQPPKNTDVVEKLDALGSGVEKQTDPAHTDPYDDAVLAATFGLIELSKIHDAELRALQKTVKRLGRAL